MRKAGGPATGSGTYIARREHNDALRVELVAILKETGNAWMSTRDLAEAVNHRNRCPRPDGAEITIIHVGRQTRNYSNIFQRFGNDVRLRDEHPSE